jgi:hypothetical protein
MFQVSRHKTAEQFVCNLVMDSDLYEDLHLWHQSRKTLTGVHLFCDLKGDQLKSNYLATISTRVLGGAVRDMRKVPYYTVSNLCLIPTILSSIVFLITSFSIGTENPRWHVRSGIPRNGYAPVPQTGNSPLLL